MGPAMQLHIGQPLPLQALEQGHIGLLHVGQEGVGPLGMRRAHGQLDERGANAPHMPEGRVHSQP